MPLSFTVGWLIHLSVKTIGCALVPFFHLDGRVSACQFLVSFKSHLTFYSLLSIAVRNRQSCTVKDDQLPSLCILTGDWRTWYVCLSALNNSKLLVSSTIFATQPTETVNPRFPKPDVILQILLADPDSQVYELEMSCW